MKDLSNSGVCVGNDRAGLAAYAAANFAHGSGGKCHSVGQVDDIQFAHFGRPSMFE
jgi:hypothetical protein